MKERFALFKSWLCSFLNFLDLKFVSLCENQKKEQKDDSLLSLFTKRAKRASHSFKKRKEQFALFCQNISDWHKKPKSEFPTLYKNNCLYPGLAIGLQSLFPLGPNLFPTLIHPSACKNSNKKIDDLRACKEIIFGLAQVRKIFVCEQWPFNIMLINFYWNYMSMLLLVNNENQW